MPQHSTPSNSSNAPLWNRFQTAPRLNRSPYLPPKRSFAWVLKAALPLALTFIAAVGVLLPPNLSNEARVALFCFVLATILWSTTALNAAYVALGASMLLVVAGGAEQSDFYDALDSDVIWLMIGAFILGSAVQKTGLAERLTGLVVAGRTGENRSVSRVFWLVTVLLLPLTFLIPSTSGRGAVVLPLFESISKAAGDKNVTRGLALLLPCVILVSTISTLIGAGSHLIANDLLDEISDTKISFAQWVLWGAPFGVVASFLTCGAILLLFVPEKTRSKIVELPAQPRKAFNRNEKFTLALVGVMVALWLTEGWHGFEIALVTVAGALILTLPAYGVLKWKDALKSVSWNLVLFVAAALVLGEALIETKAVNWIIDSLFSFSGLSENDSPLFILLVLGFLTLTSHIYMTSHAARAAALVPALLYLGQSLDLDPITIVFIGTVGMDYCLTFPVSSKALLLFQELDEPTYAPSDLLKLSALLLPLHLILMVVFYFGFWQHVGLTLTR